MNQDETIARRDVEPLQPTEEAARGAHPSSAATTGGTRPQIGHTIDKPVKILFFSANSQDDNQLALEQEYREIEQRIRLARHRDSFLLIPRFAARRSDLQDALLEHSPVVVHFACHGSAQAEIYLLGDGPASDPVPAASLASMFSVLRDNLVLVVFNACFASAQAAAIRSCARLAIGMRARIADRSAIAFASSLYGALAYGRSVQDAFDLATAALAADQRQLPQLFCAEHVDPRRVYLAESARRGRRWWALVAGVVACCALGAGWLALPYQRASSPSPVRGMVRFAAAEVRPGVSDVSQRPELCAKLDEADDCAQPVHTEQAAPVHVAAFELDVLEVSNSEFAGWLNANHPLWTIDPYGRIVTPQGNLALALASEDCFGALAITAGRVISSSEKARWPVVCVTWFGAAEYCRAQHKRLPLALEWELAARGAEGRPFPWGRDPPRQDGITFDLRDSATPHPRDVGSSPQDISPEGVHDLGGNVAEWVEDGGDVLDQKMIRGGSWGSRGPCHLLGSGCKRIAGDKFGKDVGFRCASSVIESR